MIFHLFPPLFQSLAAAIKSYPNQDGLCACVYHFCLGSSPLSFLASFLPSFRAGYVYNLAAPWGWCQLSLGWMHVCTHSMRTLCVMYAVYAYGLTLSACNQPFPFVVRLREENASMYYLAYVPAYHRMYVRTYSAVRSTHLVSKLVRMYVSSR